MDFLEVVFSECLGQRVIVDELAIDATSVGPVWRRGELQNDAVCELGLELPPRLGGYVVRFVDEKVAYKLRHPQLDVSACLGDSVHRRDDNVDTPEDAVDLVDRLGNFVEGSNDGQFRVERETAAVFQHPKAQKFFRDLRPQGVAGHNDKKPLDLGNDHKCQHRLSLASSRWHDNGRWSRGSGPMAKGGMYRADLRLPETGLDNDFAYYALFGKCESFAPCFTNFRALCFKFLDRDTVSIRCGGLDPDPGSWIFPEFR